MEAELDQDGSSLESSLSALNDTAWGAGFFSDSYAAVSTESYTDYSPSDDLFTDGKSTLAPEDSGSVAAVPEDELEDTPLTPRAPRIIVEHTTVTEYLETEEPWRNDVLRQSLSSGNWVKIVSRP